MAETIAQKTALRYAHRYAERGMRVFPLNGKKPLPGSQGLLDATSHADQIEVWWGRRGYNIGIATGEPSGFWVIDLDGDDGEASWKRIIEEHGPVPETVEVTTGRGRHLWWKLDGDDVRNSASRIGRGIDVRGTGGYVVAPPSIHPDTGSVYTFSGSEIAEPPGWLVKLAVPLVVVSRPDIAPDVPTTFTGEGIGTRYGVAALRDSLADLAAAQEGTRNDTLNRLAFKLGQLVGGGQLNEDAVREHLTEVAEQIGLSAGEIAATLDSAIPKGIEEPRVPEPRAPKKEPAPRDPHDPDDHNLTDTGNAERLRERAANQITFVPEWGSWVVWTGRFWERDIAQTIMRHGIEVARSIMTEAATESDKDRSKKIAGWSLRSESRSGLQSMIKVAESLMATRAESFDSDPWTLNTLSGIVNVKDGSSVEHDPEAMMAKITGASFDPDAQAPTWERFLSEILPDEEIRSFVQRALGYTLTGSTREQVMFLMWGSGANGKSTLIEAVRSVFGTYAVNAPATTFMERRTQGIPNDIARLQGARLVTVTETESGQAFSESTLKGFVSGDVLSARYLHAEFFDFRPIGKLWLATNHKPRIKGADEAIWRRIRLIPFLEFIPEEDRDQGLSERLEREKEGILAWMLRGAADWLSGGLRAPDAVLQATDRYRSESDVLGAFIEDRCSLAPAVTTHAHALYAEYRDWCEDAGERPWTQRSFGLRLGERGDLEKIKSHGESRRAAWRGIMIGKPLVERNDPQDAESAR